jgi:hypothetical protein
MVSDALMLATDRDAQEALAALWDALPALGRPPGTTVTDDELRRVIALVRQVGHRVTLQAIADTSGKFTYDNLRYFLRVNRRRLRDYL